MLQKYLQTHALLAQFSCTRVPPMHKVTRLPACSGEARNFGLVCAQQVFTFPGDEWVVGCGCVCGRIPLVHLPAAGRSPGKPALC